MARSKKKKSAIAAGIPAAASSNATGLSKSARRRARAAGRMVGTINPKRMLTLNDSLDVLQDRDASSFRDHLRRRQKIPFKGGLAIGKADPSMVKDAKLYAESLVFPELCIPVKIPDSNVTPSSLFHADVEVTQPGRYNASFDSSNYYAGFAVPANPFAVYSSGSYVGLQGISSVGASGLFTWGNSGTYPSTSANGTIATNFADVRTVSQALRLLDLSPEQLRGGEFIIGRVVGYNSNFESQSNGSVLPLTWAAASSVPGNIRLVNTDRSARITYMPAQLDNQPAYVPGTTDQEGIDWIFILVKYPYNSGTAPSLTMNIVGNYEGFPYEETSFLFDDAVEVGSQDWMAIAFHHVQSLLQSGATTVVSLNNLLNELFGMNLVGAGRKMLGFMGQSMGSLRSLQLLQVALTSMTDDEFVTLIRQPDRHSAILALSRRLAMARKGRDRIRTRPPPILLMTEFDDEKCSTPRSAYQVIGESVQNRSLIARF
jgi:hypothetical protein